MTTSTLPTKRLPARTDGLSTATLNVPGPLIKDLTDVFRMLSDTNRLKIVMALAREGRMHVKALCALVGQTQPAVSHHLTLMRSVGLVDYDRDGKKNQYFLASNHLCDLFKRFFAAAGGPCKELAFDEFRLLFTPTEAE